MVCIGAFASIGIYSFPLTPRVPSLESLTTFIVIPAGWLQQPLLISDNLNDLGYIYI